MLDGVIKCADCGVSRQTKLTKTGAPRLPGDKNGLWKRHSDAVYCRACWAKRFRLAVVCIPIAGPVGRDNKEFSEAIIKCWSLSTELANWTVNELAKGDTIRASGMERLPPMPRLYLYPAARERFPALPSRTVVALQHFVEARYRKARLQVVWQSLAALPRYRYPVPFPVHNQAWSVSRGEGGQYRLSVRLLNEPWALRLRGGPGFRSSLAVLGQVLDGSAVPCELAIYRQRANLGDHRNGVEDRVNGGGNRTVNRIMARLIAWLPRPPQAKQRSGILEVRTGTHALFVAPHPTRERPWVLKANHVRRWIKLHRLRLDQTSIRCCPQVGHERQRLRAQRRSNLADICTRHQNRMRTFCHQAAAMLVSFADRCNVTELRYDDSEHGYFGEFPWHKLRTLLAQKLDDKGIRFVHASVSGGVEEEREAA